MMKMNCTEFQDTLAAYIEGTLDAGMTSVCRHHLDTCTDCRSLEESSVKLQQRLLKRGRLASDISLADSVMERIRTQEIPESTREPERSTFMSKLLKWRWSLGMGAMATAAVMILFAIFATPSVQVAGAEILARGANAVEKLFSIHLRGKFRFPWVGM
ncbi:MAG: zf-HC2 domain-containing protein [Candidatus Ozemobacteraceae bacterium]